MRDSWAVPWAVWAVCLRLTNQVLVECDPGGEEGGGGQPVRTSVLPLRGVDQGVRSVSGRRFLPVHLAGVLHLRVGVLVVIVGHRDVEEKRKPLM